MSDLNNFVSKMDKSVDTMLKADENWFFGSIKMMAKKKLPDSKTLTHNPL